jgi:membrane protein
MLILKRFLNDLKNAYFQWLDDKAMKLSASLSFYSILSLVPFLVIIVSIIGFFFGHESATSSIVSQVKDLVGSEGAELIKKLSSYSFFTDSEILPSIISTIILIVGSLAVFIELKESLNIIWGIEVKTGKGLKLFLKNRIVTFPIVLAIGFLLVVSLMVSALISLLSKFLAAKLPDILPILQLSDILVSLFVFALLFGMLYKYLPDVKIEIKYIWPGALLTAILFNIGKYLIGIYLGNTYYGNVYGAAGSLVIILIWIYFSSMIFFFGAEFVYVTRQNRSEKKLKISKDFLKVPKTSQQLKEAASAKIKKD